MKRKEKEKRKEKKKKRPVFALFKTFSWETDLWVTLGDFTVKNAKLPLGREICIWPFIANVKQKKIPFTKYILIDFC